MNTKSYNGKKIEPSQYGLSSRTELRQKSKEKLTILINRKSRIIMKDGHAILAKAAKIREKDPEISIEVETTAPVCSKTQRFLLENGIYTVEG